MKKILPIILLAVSARGLFAAEGTPKIEAMHAYLFCHNDGSFSKDVFAEKNPNLTNTVIGEGFAGKPTSSTLVTVAVSGKINPGKDTILEVVVNNQNGKVLQKKTSRVTIFEPETKFFYGVWLDGTGAAPVKVTARLVNVPGSKPITKVLGFEING
jgi:hypothetical protein